MKKLRGFLTFVTGLFVFGLAALGAYHLYTSFTTPTSQITPVERLAQQSWSANVPVGETPRGVVIFVHGLQGHYLDTWRPAGGPLLMDLMNKDEDLASYDIWSLGYPTKIAADMTSISAVMDRVAEFLDEKTAAYHRVVLVGHSLGGLIARGALVRSGFGKRPHQRCTFITLGTPFGGSSLANYGALIPNLTSYQTRALRTVDPNGEVLNGDWQRIRQEWGLRLRHFSGYETKPISANQLVVDPDSANLNVRPERGDEKTPFDADHFTICKLASSSAKGFGTIKRWVLGLADGDAIDFRSLPPGASFQPFGIVEMKGEIEINRDLQIPMGSRLVISRGAVVKFRNGAILTGEGRIVAVGTKEEPIVFDFDEASCREAALLLKGPFVENSQFVHCHFQHGNGVAIERADPRREEKSGPLLFWYTLTQRLREENQRSLYTKRLGGAVVLWNANKVVFEECTFRKNEAWNGGAAILLNSRGIKFHQCRFEENRGAFGGGALYTQSSEMLLESCHFLRNSATAPTAARVRLYHGAAEMKPDLDAALRRPTYACGGAIYAGHRSQVNARYATVLEGNEATYVGGGAYFLDTSPDGGTRDASMLVEVRFKANTAGFTGGGLHVDGSSRVHVTNAIFDGNVAKGNSGSGSPGHAFVDQSKVTTLPTESGVKLNGTIWVNAAAELGSAALPLNASFDVRKESPPDIREGLPLPIENQFMENPASFRKTPGRAIDTVIIHHVSAINWATDKRLRIENRARVEAFERQHPVAERKFDWQTCREIFEIYGVSSHYLIDREGKVIRLVAEKDIAFHAGESVMPDGRTSVNNFSIGIELISSHPDDDPEVKSGRTPAYTESQYKSLLRLIADLRTRHRIPPSQVLGHDQIAPQRKKDPGPLFDWKRVRAAIDAEPATP